MKTEQQHGVTGIYDSWEVHINSLGETPGVPPAGCYLVAPDGTVLLDTRTPEQKEKANDETP